MRRASFIATVVILATATVALAAGPITRTGAEYSGAANPGNCEIDVHADKPGVLHVSCLESDGATGGARIRWRFLADVGGVRAPATVSSDVQEFRGETVTRWMQPIRTLRIEVPFGTYAHIRSVRWEQP